MGRRIGTWPSPWGSVCRTAELAVVLLHQSYVSPTSRVVDEFWLTFDSARRFNVDRRSVFHPASP
jgi:hypothetical protein